MDLIEAKIAEIKNLNLIYVYSIDSALKEISTEYIGARVLYDTDKVFTLDYKNKHFSKFIKKLLERYNKERGKRNIVLLGELTKQLVNDPLFLVIEEKEEVSQTSGILVNRKKNEIELYKKYLDKALKIIFKAIKNYDCVNIDSIDGFNHKYIINYSIGNIKKQMHMLIFVDDNCNIDFRISNIDGENVKISGNIDDYVNVIKINWYDDIKNLKGFVTYDSEEQVIEESLYKGKEPIIVRQSTNTLLDEDEEIINFYMNLCNLQKLKNVIKIDDNCYFLSEFNASTVKEEDNILYNNITSQISIFDDKVIIRTKRKDGISKYSNQIKVILYDVITEYILKKIKVENKFYILMEKRTIEDSKTNYNYSVLNLEENVDLSKPFNIKGSYEIEQELKSFDMAKQYIKGGK